ncbi:MAG: 4Fe-4S dicluster domain-containing protein [Candidatus Helarchaeota archaeon]
MNEKILQKTDLPKFVKELEDSYNIFAPVKSNGFYIFQHISSTDDFTLDFDNTRIPPKDVFFPRREVLFTYKKTPNGIEIYEQQDPAQMQVILGIRPCDARALKLMDKFFNSGKFSDPYFQKRRINTILIGLACNNPLSTCFCTSIESGPFNEEGLDVMLIDLGEKYLIKSLSAKGSQLLEHLPWLPDANEKDLFDATELTKEVLASMNEEINLDNIKEHLDNLFENEDFWLKFSQSCIGCGSCTFLCPTCHCFDVVDEETPSGGKRVRLWDNCQFPLFTLHGSGHNPRPTKRARLRQRVMHKFNYYPKILQEIGCVGCGRCVRVCPVNLDIRITLQEAQKTVQ